MGQDLFRKEAIEHKRERLWGDVIVVQPLSFSVLSIVITIIVALIIALLVWGNYARRETVSGYLVPNAGLAKVYARDTGIVSKTLVNEGDFVEIGAKLLTVSTGRATEEASDLDAAIIEELNKTQSDLEAKLEEQQLLSSVENEKLIAQIGGLKNEVKQLESQLATTKERFLLAQKRVDDFKSLKTKGHVSEDKFQQEYEDLLDNKLNYDETRQQLTAKNNALTNAEFEFKQLPLRLTIQLTDLRNAISEIKQRKFNIEGQRNFTLYAPTSGRVTALQAHEGKSITTNTPVLAILPAGAQFEAELFVPTRAIGFIKNGQKVMIRYAAFPYQRFGLYEGAVSKVAEIILSPDELPVPVDLQEPVYRVTVSLNEQKVSAYGQELPLQSGMLLDADIILDQLTLIDWLLDPLYSLKGRL